MKTLRKGDFNTTVTFLNAILNRSSYSVYISPKFDENTHTRVVEFQKANGLVPDGIVGKKTWKKLFVMGYDFNWGTTNFILDKDEWMNQYTEKDTIYLHHTAGLHRPDYTIGWWNRDNKPGKLRRVATSFVIGRRSLDGNGTFDGITYRAFNEIYWAHHLGTKLGINKALNQKSIGIEICSLGPVTKASDGTFYFQSNTNKIVVPNSDVCELKKEWRGYKYYQKYTDKQIKECERLILTLAKIFEIPLNDIVYDTSWFTISERAMKGDAGLWTHCNVRTDKTDCFPQPEFIAMLNGLHAKYQDFQPDYAVPEIAPMGSPNTLDEKLVTEYSQDLD